MATSMRIATPQIRDRIDATYYHPKFVENELRLKRSGIPVGVLNRLIEKGRRAIYFQTSTLEKDEAPKDWVPFLTADDLGKEGIFIDLDARRRVSPAFANRYPNGLVRPNELLVKVKGPNQTTAYVEGIPDKKVLVSGTIWGGIVRTDKIDPWSLVTVLSSEFGAVARTRLRTNLNVEFLSPEDLLRLELPMPESAVQNYIGEKVRQAERLRARARKLDGHLLDQESSIIPIEAPPESNKKGWRVSKANATAFRLNPEYFRVHHLLKEKASNRNDFELLEKLVDKFSYGTSTKADYVPRGTGISFVRGCDLDRNRIRQDEILDLSKKHLNEVGKNLLGPEDVIITRSGTVGIASSVPKSLIGSAYGSFMIKMSVRDGWDPIFVAWVLNSWLGQRQIRRLESGAVQLNINIEELKTIRIWSPSIEVQKDIGNQVERVSKLQAYSTKLTTTAKLLVEALIEGKISETDLIAAQKTLEAGDRTADRKILSSLTPKGMDIPGEPPLFPDLDGLYEALDALEGSEDTP